MAKGARPACSEATFATASSGATIVPTMLAGIPRPSSSLPSLTIKRLTLPSFSGRQAKASFGASGTKVLRVVGSSGGRGGAETSGPSSSASTHGRHAASLGKGMNRVLAGLGLAFVDALLGRVGIKDLALAAEGASIGIDDRFTQAHGHEPRSLVGNSQYALHLL